MSQTRPAKDKRERERERGEEKKTSSSEEVIFVASLTRVQKYNLWPFVVHRYFSGINHQTHALKEELPLQYCHPYSSSAQHPFAKLMRGESGVERLQLSAALPHPV